MAHTAASESTQQGSDDYIENQSLTTPHPAVEERSYTHSVPWQRVPEPRQKRLLSPEHTPVSSKMQKTNQARQQQFDNNRPASDSPPAITTSNSFSILNMDEGVEDTDSQATNQPRKPKSEPKPPPVILYGIDDLSELTKCIEEAVDKTSYTYKIVSKNQLIISTKTIESYKKLIDHIREKGLIGHTFTRKDEKCQKIVIKNLHYSTPKEAIKEAIESTGNTVRGEIVNARRRGSKEPYNVFFVNIEPHENNRLIKDLTYIYHQRVTIEDPKKTKSIAQCMRCQQYGHTKNNCMRPYRCVKCAGPHKTTECTKSPNTPATCALCEGSHPANYRGCQVYREVLTRKSQPVKRYIKNKQISQSDATTNANKEPPPPLTLPQLQLTQENYPVLPNKDPLNNKIIKDPSSQNKPSTNYQYDHNGSQPNQPNQSQMWERNQSSNDIQTMLINSLNKQAEKIDQLVHTMGILMNLVTTLLNKLP